MDNTNDTKQQAPGSEQPQTGQPVETGAAGEDRVKELEAALEAKEAEAKENWNKFLRERADLENYRKRAQREKEEILKYGNEGLITEILPVIDSMDRALAHAGDEAQGALLEGVKLTHGMLLSALKKYGVEPVDAGPGTPFDPAIHHAMSQVETSDISPNTVAAELQKGYTIQGRLLRAAMVAVAVAPRTAE